MNRNRSEALFEKGKLVIPGGVNSPVRAFRAVGGHPVFMKSAKGAFLYDEDGNEYIDLINSWGPMLLGHANPIIEEAVRAAIPSSLSFGAPTAREVEMAELIISMVPSIEKVRMVNSGTEATMSAIRVARGYTKRDKILKFEGCYHGHGDAFLIAAGSGAMTMGVPDSLGVTANVAKDTLTAIFNDLDSVESLVKAYENHIAAIIVEPVVGNMGCVAPKPGFLEGLRAICNKYGIVLIFDEVMTGFRLSAGGAQQLFKVKPDLTTLGKIIGGGMPVGAYGGKKEIMDCVSPLGGVYQAGTLSGNPIAMAAGLAILTQLKNDPSIYTKLETISKSIVDGWANNLSKLGLSYTINRVGSMFSLFFTEKEVYDFTSAKSSNVNIFGHYFHEMLNRGIYLAPAQFEALFVSTALDQTCIDKIISAHYASLEAVFEKNA